MAKEYLDIAYQLLCSNVCINLNYKWKKENKFRDEREAKREQLREECESKREQEWRL